MSEIEKNKQVVQDGLNKRNNRRKKAAIEAEQEAITTQMISIVNRNAYDAEMKRQKQQHDLAREERLAIRKEKFAVIKANGIAAIRCLWVSVVLFIIASILCTTELVQLWQIVVTFGLAIAMFIFSVYEMWQNAGEFSDLN